jgi:hypothetical protein
VRVVVDPRVCTRDAYTVEQLDGTLLGLPAVYIEVRLERLADLPADGQTGLRLVIGSRKMIAMSLPRIFRIARSGK